MNQDKFYTPKIEELHVGMEVTTRPKNLSWMTKSKEEWKTVKVTPENFQTIAYCIDEGREVYTPYLTPEQIIEEGWEYHGVSMVGDNYIYHLYHWQLVRMGQTEFEIGTISHWGWENKLSFTIKNAHQLRQVMEMVGIKKENQ